MLHKETQQALRALGALAGTNGPLTIAQLTGPTHTHAPILAKVLQRLSHFGFVAGRPGRGGGYDLTRPAEGIRLIEVVQAFEGSGFGSTCLLGQSSCEVECALHAGWATFQGQLLDFLEHRTVADLIR